MHLPSPPRQVLPPRQGTGCRSPTVARVIQESIQPVPGPDSLPFGLCDRAGMHLERECYLGPSPSRR